MILSDAGIRRAVAGCDIALDPMPESARSSLARLGLMVHLTAPTIHAGCNGNITLEVINHGPFHLKEIFDSGELMEAATIKRYLIVRQEGARQVQREVLHYNLEVTLAMSEEATCRSYLQVRQEGGRDRRDQPERVKC